MIKGYALTIRRPSSHTCRLAGKLVTFLSGYGMGTEILAGEITSPTPPYLPLTDSCIDLAAARFSYSYKRI